MSAFAFGVRPPSDDDARFLLSQQVIFGRQQVLGLGIISSLLALLVALAFVDTSPWPVTAGWFVLVAVGIVIAISGWRLRKKKGREPRDADRSARKFVRQAVTISILWGAAYWFTMPVENVGMQFLLIFCAAGAAAGTVTGFGPLPTVWGPMILITVLPPAIKQCVHAERIDLITCGGLLLFVAGVGFLRHHRHPILCPPDPAATDGRGSCRTEVTHRGGARAFFRADQRADRDLRRRRRLPPGQSGVAADPGLPGPTR